jgi:hypothetical protein
MRCVVRVGILSLLVLVAGCGSSGPRTASAVTGLPEYTPEETALFGDTMTPQVFGLPAQQSDESDLKLASRARYADTVVPVRVSTVTREKLAGVQAFVLVLTPEGPPVVGRPPDSPLELRIQEGGPSLPRVAMADTKLVGVRFLVFLKHYVQAGEPALHFHGEADSPATRAVVKSAKRLDAPGPEVQTSP